MRKNKAKLQLIEKSMLINEKSETYALPNKSLLL